MPTEPFSWQVGPLQRGDAQIVSYIGDYPALGGAPSDRTVYEAITFLKSKGLQVTMYPFIMMDVPSNNTLPNPYGGNRQPAYPWRYRITCHPAPDEPGTVDKTAPPPRRSTTSSARSTPGISLGTLSNSASITAAPTTNGRCAVLSCTWRPLPMLQVLMIS